MDFKAFDRAQRKSSPLQLDVIESFAQRRINRRQFVQRGTLIPTALPPTWAPC